MPRSPRLAHKAPVMQAAIRVTASVWTVLLLPFCDQARPWFRFSKRASSVVGLPLCLVSFSRAGLVVLFCGENGTAVLSTELWLWALIPAWWIERQSSLTEESSQKSEVRTRKLEVRSQKSEVGNHKWEIGSGKWEVGSGKSEVGNRKSEVRSRKSEVGSEKLEVGSLKLEVGSQKSEDPPRLSYFGKRMTPPFIALGTLLLTLSLLEITLYRNWTIGA